MKLNVTFSKRDFSDPLDFPDLTIAPTRYSWAALGGPERATLLAQGSPTALWRLLDWLRAPVEIGDARGVPVWWGYLSEVVIHVGRISVGLSLDAMANRVAVVYSYVAPGSNTVGTRATTAWAQDDDAVAAYGVKELLDSLDGATPVTAEARRDATLARLRYPVPLLEFAPEADELQAELHCRGWWETLAWRYYSRTAGLEQHTSGTAQQNLGQAVESPDVPVERVAQSFSLGGAEGWQAYNVHVRLRKVGSPSDAVTVTLCADSGGAPGTVLTSASVAGSALSEVADWVTFTLSATPDLALGTTYWIVLRRTGALHAENYYVVTLDDSGGYSRGVLRIYVGGAWTDPLVSQDLTFKVGGVEETATQIARAIDSHGAFFTGVDLLTASGLASSPYRDGDTTTLQVVRELLQSGTSNGRRLLATVTRERTLRIYEEPALDPYQVSLFVTADGQPVGTWGAEILTHICPVAQWAALRDVFPPTLDVAAMADPTYFFIERAEFDVARWTWTPEPRGIPSLWDVGQIAEG